MNSNSLKEKRDLLKKINNYEFISITIIVGLFLLLYALLKPMFTIEYYIGIMIGSLIGTEYKFIKENGTLFNRLSTINKLNKMIDEESKTNHVAYTKSECISVSHPYKSSSKDKVLVKKR